MSVQLPSDIVLDVARAANPVRYQAAVAKLSAAATGSFSMALDVAQAGATRAPPADVDTILTRLRSGATLAPRGKAGGAAEDFEAFVLQTFVESMLPKGAEAVFGKGNAGGIWKSMLAEQIGAQIAKSGGLGIARTINAGRPMPGAQASADRHPHAA
jgi:hypothetical protein